MPPSTRRPGGDQRYPYVVRWRLMVPGFRDHWGELSAHKRPEAAIKAARRSRDAISIMWQGEGWPWFKWFVIDSRDGTVVRELW